jgi:hypothetical protein
MDTHAKRKNISPNMKQFEEYGFIDYFLLFECNGMHHPLAYVQWTTKIEEKAGVKSFRSMKTGKEFINVQIIDRSVGFLKINGRNCIIDREDAVNDEFQSLH